MASIHFDIGEDELPIFLAESEEHLQELDDALLRLERLENDDDLIQHAFRAAHTLKGMAGMIGHRRMMDLTHMLETVFDSMRKKSLSISSQIIDLCLKAVDGLRILKNEILTYQEADLDLEWYALNFSTFIHTGWMETLVSNLPHRLNQPETAPDQVTDHPGEKQAAPASAVEGAVWVEAHIAPDSIAPSARAFQLMMALREVGSLQNMEPTEEQIDASMPMQVFRALLTTNLSREQIYASLKHISEIDQVIIDGQMAYRTPRQPSTVHVDQPILPEPARLGDYLVSEGMISAQQLKAALAHQQNSGERQLLGSVLVQQGSIHPEKLNQAITHLVESARTGSAPRASVVEKTVRASVERLDNLMILVGELITDRNRLTQINHQFSYQEPNHEQLGNLANTITHLTRITDQIQEEVMRIRMLPIASVFNKFPRLVRDLSQQLGKEVDLVIKGEDTELDRSVMEEINDPLIHLIRNALDHGIEMPSARLAAGKSQRGVITLTARHEQGHIIITVEDDGAGIPAEKIRQKAVQKGLLSEADADRLSDEKVLELIFLPGFSTVEKVTDVSGRGVGMDIVRSNIQRINGTVLVESRVGRGTCFQLILPLTLAIIPTLLVRVGQNCFAIPLVMVTETQRLPRKEIHKIQGKPVVKLRDQLLPLLYLDRIFKITAQEASGPYLHIVVVRSGKLQAGLVVDRLVDEEEVVVKSLGALVKNIPGISSAAIMGTGEIALILDIPGLFNFCKVERERE